MAPRVLGRLEEFNPNSDSVTEYVQHANIFFMANEVPDGKKVSVFLSAVGENLHVFVQSVFTNTATREVLC